MISVPRVPPPPPGKVMVGGAPRPPCGCGPLWGLIFFILIVFCSFFGAGGGFALAPSVVVGPSWG